jgi:formylglycine-generating enzyme required for sulfatase activity
MEEADQLQKKRDYFGAAKAYRSALAYTAEKVERATIEEWIDVLLDKGIGERLGAVDEMIGRKQYETARNELDALLALKEDERVLAGRRKVLSLMAMPPDMVFVDTGEFEKGTPEISVGNPVGRLTKAPFYIAKYEVTNHQFKEFVDIGGYRQEKYWDRKGWAMVPMFVSADGHQGPVSWQKGKFPEGAGDEPVRGISFHEAAAYAKWLSENTGKKYRLPDEHQWEKAASWSNPQKKRTTYPWGDEWDAEHANFGDAVHTIGTDTNDVSPSGCCDMAGNVHEWARAAGDEQAAVIKGGAADIPEDLACSMARAYHLQRPYEGFRGQRVGFRLMIPLDDGEDNP